MTTYREIPKLIGTVAEVKQRNGFFGVSVVITRSTMPGVNTGIGTFAVEEGSAYIPAAGDKVRVRYAYDDPKQVVVERARWTDILPEEAKQIRLPHAGVHGPVTNEGKACPWPWEPQLRTDVPKGTQYECPHCTSIVLAGAVHVDYVDNHLLFD